MDKRGYILLLAIGCWLLAGCGRTATVEEVSIVPEPLFVVEKEGSFTLHNTVRVSVSGIGQNTASVRYILQSMRKMHMRPRMVATTESSDMRLLIEERENPEMGTEGYMIEVRPGGVTLRANSEEGLFYAYQSLVQMLPADMEERVYGSVVLPECTVLDRPRMGWRGVELDAGHVAFSPREVRRWIEVMAMYKMNRLVVRSEEDWLSDEERESLVEYGMERNVKLVEVGCDSGYTAVADGEEMPLVCANLKEGMDSARAGRRVAMSPEEYCDLATYPADARYQGVAAEGMTTLAKAYQFDPAPIGTNQHVEANICGGLCRLSTSRLSSTAEAEYMLLPRMLAIAEALWSQRDSKNWMRFRRRVESEKDRLEAKGYSYCEGSFTPMFTARKVDDRTMSIAIETEVPNTYIFYTTDGTTPTRQSNIYLGPFDLERGTHLKILPVYKNIERDSVYEYIIR